MAVAYALDIENTVRKGPVLGEGVRVYPNGWCVVRVQPTSFAKLIHLEQLAVCLSRCSISQPHQILVSPKQTYGVLPRTASILSYSFTFS